MKIRFGDCTFDPDARRLWREGADVHLSPKAFELLRLLVESRPRAMSKAELLERIWPDVFVSDVSLARVVNEVREAVGDHAREGRIVRTVHAFGYAFVAELEETEPRPPLTEAGRRPLASLISADRQVFLFPGEHIIGRDPAVEVCLDSPKISRRHARIVVKTARTTIEDLGSKNGTFVRGIRISEPTALEDGDEIRVGPFTMTFRTLRAAASTETQVL